MLITECQAEEDNTTSCLCVIENLFWKFKVLKDENLEKVDKANEKTNDVEKTLGGIKHDVVVNGCILINSCDQFGDEVRTITLKRCLKSR